MKARGEESRTGADWALLVSPRSDRRSIPSPPTGPCGRLLRKMGRHAYRPGHIHMIVSAAWTLAGDHTTCSSCGRANTSIPMPCLGMEGVAGSGTSNVSPGVGPDGELHGPHRTIRSTTTSD